MHVKELGISCVLLPDCDDLRRSIDARQIKDYFPPVLSIKRTINKYERVLRALTTVLDGVDRENS